MVRQLRASGGACLMAKKKAAPKKVSLAKELSETIGALQALEIRVQALEAAARGDAPYRDPHASET